MIYPQNVVWYIESRPLSGDRDKPGYAPADPAAMGSGVAVEIEQMDNNRKPFDPPKTRKYLLTCAHVVRQRTVDGALGWGAMLEEIHCWQPGMGYSRTYPDSRRSGKQPGVWEASVADLSPCGAMPNEVPRDLRLPQNDWVLLDFQDPRFQTVPSVRQWSAVATGVLLKIIGFPGGAGWLEDKGRGHFWDTNALVESATPESFRQTRTPEHGLLKLDGPDETRPGMSGGGVFDTGDRFVGIHRSSMDATMERGAVSAAWIKEWLFSNRNARTVSQPGAVQASDARVAIDVLVNPLDIEITLTVGKAEVTAKRTHDEAERSAHLDFEDQRAEIVGLFQEWLRENRLNKRRELEIFGKQLFGALFNGDVLSFFESNLAEVQKRAGEQPNSLSRIKPALRVQLSFRDEGAALASLPWEFMYYAPKNGRGFFLATERDIVLSRYMPLREGRQLLAPGKRSLRVLVVVSAPDDPDLGPVAAEPIIEAIEELAAHQPIQIEILKKPTVHSFVEKLETSKPHVLHFIGHGRFNQKEGKGEIAFLDFDETTARWVQDSDFAEFFNHMRAVPRLAFLHLYEGGVADFTAGSAGIAPKMMLAGVQAVIAMQYPITSRAAISFSRAFYRELVKGSPVDQAVQAGRYTITLDDPASYGSRVFGTPVLYMRSRDGVILIDN